MSWGKTRRHRSATDTHSANRATSRTSPTSTSRGIHSPATWACTRQRPKPSCQPSPPPHFATSSPQVAGSTSTDAKNIAKECHGVSPEIHLNYGQKYYFVQSDESNWWASRRALSPSGHASGSSVHPRPPLLFAGTTLSGSHTRWEGRTTPARAPLTHRTAPTLPSRESAPSSAARG